MTAKDAGQAWFWTEAWQAGEAEADKDLESGRFTRLDDDAALFRKLER
jgi:hypothetical protein